MSLSRFLSRFFGGPFCQSCAMPLKQDPKKGGTEADGSLSLDYCSFCYANGHFTVPDATLEQMQSKVREIMVGMKFEPKLIDRTVQFIPRLKRWRKA